jgi:tetratricopeptide (TPR) repeat protein
MYEELKQPDRAIEAYQENLRLQPSYADGHLHLGFLLYRLKRSSEAIPHLAEAAKLNPKQPDAHLLLGLTYLQMDRYTDALAAFQTGVQYNPANPDLLFNLGTAYDKLNRFDDLVQAMESALRLDPKHSDALNYLGYSYADRGIKIAEAVSLIKRAVSIKPNNGYYVDSLGWAFFKMGMLDEALTEIKKAALLVTDDPVIYEHLGEIYLGQNLIREGREAWLRSLELDPSNAKLMQRYRERGLGDPAQEERVQQARRKISQHATPQPLRQ